jgi:hypothetical protein
LETFVLEILQLSLEKAKGYRRINDDEHSWPILIRAHFSIV